MIVKCKIILTGPAILGTQLEGGKFAEKVEHNFEVVDYAMTFDEFGQMVSRIRDITAALGDGVNLSLLDDEYAFRKKVEQKMFSKRPIKAGDQIQQEDILWLRHAGNGITKSEQELVSKFRATKDIESDMLITWSLLSFDH